MYKGYSYEFPLFIVCLFFNSHWVPFLKTSQVYKEKKITGIIPWLVNSSWDCPACCSSGIFKSLKKQQNRGVAFLYRSTAVQISSCKHHADLFTLNFILKINSIGKTVTKDDPEAHASERNLCSLTFSLTSCGLTLKLQFYAPPLGGVLKSGVTHQA